MFIQKPVETNCVGFAVLQILPGELRNTKQTLIIQIHYIPNRKKRGLFSRNVVFSARNAILRQPQSTLPHRFAVKRKRRRYLSAVPFPRQFSFPFNVSLLRSNFILFLRNKTGVFQTRKEETHLSAFMHKHWFYSLVFFVQTILHTPLMLNG